MRLRVSLLVSNQRVGHQVSTTTIQTISIRLSEEKNFVDGTKSSSLSGRKLLGAAGAALPVLKGLAQLHPISQVRETLLRRSPQGS